MKQTLRFAMLLFCACAVLAACSNFAQAQKLDIGFGVSTIDAPGASSADSNHTGVSLTGATYPVVSGDALFWHNLGIGADLSWRASQAKNYFNQGFNYRPIFWDINAVYSPKLASHTYLELVGGIGALNTHYYTGTTCGIYTCSNYQSISHFDADFGGGIKLYPTHSFFIRPEARVYLINNNQEFSSNHVTRYGISIGYTLR